MNFDIKFLAAILPIPLAYFAYVEAGLNDPSKTIFAVVFLMISVTGIFMSMDDEAEGTNEDE